MIKKVKVKRDDVVKFRNSIKKLDDCLKGKKEKAINCIDELIKEIDRNISVLEEKNRELNKKTDSLYEKKIELEKELSILKMNYDNLIEDISELKDELESIDEYIVKKNSDGEYEEFPNPYYSKIESRIERLEDKAENLKHNIEEKKERINEINRLIENIKKQNRKINESLKILQKNKNESKKQQGCFDNLVKTHSTRLDFCTHELEELIRIIDKYKYIRMKRDVVTKKTSDRKYTTKEIEKYNIKFDKDGRVSEFDGKKFGGKYISYENRFQRTPDESERGEYTGERGESKFIPSNYTETGIRVNEILKKYGLDGIEYRNAEPDFEPCSEAVVKIACMTGEWDDNFLQADIECTKLWNSQSYNGKNDWTWEEVREFRKLNKLSWHEKCDTETMVLVPTEINLYFSHSGGVAECKERDKDNNGGKFDE